MNFSLFCKKGAWASYCSGIPKKTGTSVQIMGNISGSTEESIKEKDEPELCIYQIVKEIYPEDCEKITGMLLEVDQNELKELLVNREELHNRIHTAATVVKQNSSPSVITQDMQIIGNKIYGTVQQLYPAFAKQVTGMLLELGEERLVELLDDKDQFIEHIHEAAKVVMEMRGQSPRDLNTKSTQVEINSNGSSEMILIDQEKEEIGGQIYLKVVSQYPNIASKITGMLLEMDIESLHQIKDDYGLLMGKVGEAVQVLKEQRESYGVGEAKQKYKEILQKQLNLRNITDKVNGLEVEDEQKEIIGEELYKILLALYPNYADKIAGMLLEMNINDLLETLASTELLQSRIEQAAEVLGANS